MNQKSPEERRTHSVKVRFNDEEFEQLSALCAAAGRKPGTYCRLKALEQDTQLMQIPPEFKQLRGDLGRIGNNLNQLVHHLNLGNVMEPVDALELKLHLNQLQDRLMAIQTQLGNRR